MQDGTPAGEGGNQNQPKVETKPEDVTALQAKVAEFESKLQEAIKDRDKAKSKLRELDDAEALKKGEYERLLQESKAEAENLKSELEKAKLAETQYNALIETQRTELLSKLDENHKAIANDLTIDKLKTYVELNSKGHNYDKSRSGGLSFNTDGKKWEDFTSKELQEIEKVNPELLRKLFEMRNKK